MKPNVLVLRALAAKHMAVLQQNYTLHYFETSNEPEQLIKQVAESVVAIVTSGTQVLSRDLIQRLPNLKVVVSSGVGYDSIDVESCSERGIKVSNTPDLLTNDVADMALMLILSTRRELLRGDRWVRSGDWEDKGPMSLTTTLSGKRLGIVGLGRIGQAIANRAEVMALQIGYFGRNEKPDCGYRYHEKLIDLAKWCDILVIACPGGKATAGIINEQVLTALGEQGTLINIARGSVVDQVALIEALSSRRIASAGLDVFANEPCDSTLFSDLSNVVLSPHHSSGTIETRDQMAQLVVDNLAAYFAGKPLLTAIN